MKKSWLFLVLVVIIAEVNAQSRLLEVVICNEQTRKPINDVHVFYVNTTYGSSTNSIGNVSLIVPKVLKEDLVLSHISYDSKLYDYANYISLRKNDSIFLTPNNFNLAEITIVAKQSKRWKKNYKKFLKAFIGKGKSAEACIILNPEVLRFEEVDGGLSVTAIDMIEIRNEYLGYNTSYLLSYLTISDDGSFEYFGRSIFSEINDNPTKDIIENREFEYSVGLRNFLVSLINNRVEEDDYKIESVYFNEDGPQNSQSVSRNDILFHDKKTGLYHLRFNNFLKITNKNIKELVYRKTKFAYSFLNKVAHTLVFDRNGHILNSTKMQEYGYWANQKVARTLPYNYNVFTIESSAYLISKENSNPTLAIDTTNDEIWKLFDLLIDGDRINHKKHLEKLSQNWQSAFIPPLIEFIRIGNDRSLQQNIIKLLEEHTGQNHGYDYYKWMTWLWPKGIMYDEHYAPIKAKLYQSKDIKFGNYFRPDFPKEKIRLDEILWGGVVQDGIPPLRYPKLIAPPFADYLHDDDVVFGIVINGIAKAYPQRILAWHEMFIDNFGDTDIAGVYCTLCGTVIAYNLVHNGIRHDLGTSGFLYRSNKLMYDKETQSLWSTIEGRPVVGKLVGSDIKLESYPVVTTTWGHWKSDHPYSQVLSLPSKYHRDYSEGAAYKRYFGTDELMFPVPNTDNRLRNKDEVFIIRSPGYESDPVAISVNHFKKNRIKMLDIDDLSVVVVSDDSKALRAYSAHGVRFKKKKGDVVIDEEKVTWEINDDFLVSSEGVKLERLPAHRIFWFAWVNAYPDTRLVK